MPSLARPTSQTRLTHQLDQDWLEIEPHDPYAGAFVEFRTADGVYFATADSINFGTEN